MDELKYNKIRKSLLMSWNVCPRQSWYQIRDPSYDQYNQFSKDSTALLFGQIFHKEMDKFYRHLDINKMIELVPDLVKFNDYLFKQFSLTTNETCLDYFKWYCTIEIKRFTILFNMIPNDVEKLKQRFLPMYIEKYVEYNDKENGITRTGHFDRVDYLGNNKLRLVEYKTGQSYAVDKPYKLSKLRLELYWYKQILENIDEFNKFEIVDWMLINPTTKVIFVSKFNNITKHALDSRIPKLINDINMTSEPKRNINIYCNFCKFKKECLIDVDKSIFDID